MPEDSGGLDGNIGVVNAFALSRKSSGTRSPPIPNKPDSPGGFTRCVSRNRHIDLHGHGGPAISPCDAEAFGYKNEAFSVAPGQTDSHLWPTAEVSAPARPATRFDMFCADDTPACYYYRLSTTKMRSSCCSFQVLHSSSTLCREVRGLVLHK